MKKFVTLFNSENVHLIKDVGLIPYGMRRYNFYDSYVATYDNGSYSYLQNAVNGLKLWFVEKRTGKFKIDALFFLNNNAKDIELLNLYHATFFSAVAIFVYKFKNPMGKVYLKLDAGYLKEDIVWWKRVFKEYAIKKADGVSTELTENSVEMSINWGRKIDHVPNPYLPESLKNFRDFKDRENLFISVGRLGAYLKATDILMDAFRIASKSIPDWKLILVGPIEKQECDFEKNIYEWFKLYPDMKNRVIFVGSVENREELVEYYRSAKVFVFPSRSESFGIALLEAALSGDYLICSDIPSSRSITHNYQYASCFIVDDVQGLAEKMIECCMDKELEQKAYKGYCDIRDEYQLRMVCEIIYKMMEK